MHPSYIALVLIVLAILAFPKNFNVKAAKPLIICFAIYVIIMLVSSLANSLIYGYSEQFAKTMVKWGMFFLTMILVVGTIRNIPEINFLIKWTVFSMILTSAYGIIHWVVINKMHDYLNPFWQTANQNALSNWNAGIFVLSLLLIANASALTSKLLWAAGFVIMVLAQVFTLSRFGFALVFLNCTFFVLFIKRIREIVFLLVVVLVTITVANYCVPDSFKKQVKGRIKTVATRQGVEKSTRNRLTYVTKAKEILSDNPIAGIGVGNYEIYDKGTVGASDPSHSFYLNIISETGLVGSLVLLIFSVYVILLFRASGRNISSEADRRLLFFLWGSTLVYMLRGITSHEVLFMPIAGYIFGLTIACTDILARGASRKEVL